MRIEILRLALQASPHRGNDRKEIEECTTGPDMYRSQAGPFRRAQDWGSIHGHTRGLVKVARHTSICRVALSRNVMKCHEGSSILVGVISAVQQAKSEGNEFAVSLHRVKAPQVLRKENCELLKTMVICMVFRAHSPHTQAQPLAMRFAHLPATCQEGSDRRHVMGSPRSWALPSSWAPLHSPRCCSEVRVGRPVKVGCNFIVTQTNLAALAAIHIFICVQHPRLNLEVHTAAPRNASLILPVESGTFTASTKHSPSVVQPPGPSWTEEMVAPRSRTRTCVWLKCSRSCSTDIRIFAQRARHWSKAHRHGAIAQRVCHDRLPITASKFHRRRARRRSHGPVSL